MNVRFDDIELSELGFALRDSDARRMADWKIESVEIPGAAYDADLSKNFVPGETNLTGKLSADTEDWDLFTHEYWLGRLDAFKQQLNPRKGFKKLVISGDQETRYRYARFRSMGLTEQAPIFRLPFQNVAITFQNHDAYWRSQAPTLTKTTVPFSVPNNETDDTFPIIELTISGNIVATSGATVQPVTLLTMDDFNLNWKGTGASPGTLQAGDVLVIDAALMTAILRPSGGGAAVDVIRHYDSSGPDAYIGNGFPKVKLGGSNITAKHGSVSQIVVKYEYLYL